MYVDTRPTYLWISAFWCWWTRRGLSSQQVWPEALTLLLVTCPHSIYVHTPLLYYPPSAAHCSNCSICPNGKMGLSELQNLFVHIWDGPLYYLSNAAHCSLLLLLPCVLVAYGLVSPGWPECSWPGRPSSPPSIWRTHPGATLLLLIQQLTPTGSACLVLFLPHALFIGWI